MNELEGYFRDRAAGDDQGAGAFAVAYAMLHLATALDGLARSFAPHGLGTFDSDYFLVRVAHRLDELSIQLEDLLASLVLTRPGDPPQASEFLARKARKRRPRHRAP